MIRIQNQQGANKLKGRIAAVEKKEINEITLKLFVFINSCLLCLYNNSNIFHNYLHQYTLQNKTLKYYCYTILINQLKIQIKLLSKMKKSTQALIKHNDFADIYQNQIKLPLYNQTSPKTANVQNTKRLPNIINSVQKFEKVNTAREQAIQAKNNMQTLQGRINSLKKQRQKNSKEINWAKQKISFMRTIKERCESDSKKKEEYHHKKQLENVHLKRRVSEFKGNMKKHHEQALNNLTMRTRDHSEMMRTQKKLNKTYIHEINQMLLAKNKQKNHQINEMKKQLKELKKNYLEQNKARVKEIYEGYMHNYNTIKSRAHSRIKKLSQQQQRHLEELKISETSKLNEFKTLEQILNPQTKYTKSVYKQMFKKIYTPNKNNNKIEKDSSIIN